MKLSASTCLGMCGRGAGSGGGSAGLLGGGAAHTHTLAARALLAAQPLDGVGVLHLQRGRPGREQRVVNMQCR